ncbi:MAG: SMP-30/gluconolactonase/LRE family protein [Bryobacterales bacterium]|nr:SMP-30/gluconolactonase/LRE family protein [Bryobacterales bacterium]
MRSSLCVLVGLLSVALWLPAQPEAYPLGPDSQRKPGVPAGVVSQHQHQSKIFPGTVRDYWVYVPSQYSAASPACLMVFQDGAGFVNVDANSRWRVPIVFDNLIHQREMPVTIGVFINPGVLPALSPGTQQNRYNRSYEYDGMSDRYVRFLLDEILPEVGKQYNLSSDPNCRAIGGSSSGAIAAFTAAWHRPDSFRRVLSFIGSYVNLRGGHAYDSLVRKTEPKPIRVFLQDGNRDLNIYSGSWWHANQSLGAALEFGGYDVKTVWGTEAHNNIHGSAILPDALRWIWKDWQQPILPSRKGGERHMVTELLHPASDWELLSEGHRFTEGPAVDAEGNVYFTDVPGDKLWRIDTTGKTTLFKDKPGEVVGMMFGKDGKLYACRRKPAQVITFDAAGNETVLVDGISGNDLAVTAAGEIYMTDPAAHKLWFIGLDRKPRAVHEGISFPNGIVLSPDESMVIVADSDSKWVRSFQRMPDGSLANEEPFYGLEMPDQGGRSGADGMTLDTEGYLYVTTNLGVQICDQPGRVQAILNRPADRNPSNVVFGGPGLEYLYITAVDKVWRRKIRRKGFLPWQPVNPPVPRL